MLSIGDIAHSTGVSRRMLRHWEHEGLIVPAAIDPVTRYRHYQSNQLGRVRAIAELRDLGFSLGEIRRLLDPQIVQASLEQLLLQQAAALREQIAEASTRLAKVQHRLDTIHHKSQEITMNLSIDTLPALTLWGASTTVLDETDISHAVDRLRNQLPTTTDELVLLFDGTHDDHIVVSAGIARPMPDAALDELHTPAIDQGATVCFDTPPASIADAWVLIDAELQTRQLTTGGTYRQIIAADGKTVLQAPVRPAR